MIDSENAQLKKQLQES